MQVYRFTAILFCFQTLEAYKTRIPTADTNQKRVLIPSFLNRTQIIIIDADDDGDPQFKNCVIGAVSSNNDVSYIVLKGATLPTLELSENSLRRVINRIPNYILTLTEFDASILENELFKIILYSKWSSLHLIILIKDEEYICKNGTFNEVILKKSELLLNILWHKFQIIYVTLSLPHLCFDYYITYDAKQDSGTSLYSRTIKVIAAEDLHKIYSRKRREDQYEYEYLSTNFPLKVGIFTRFPTAIKDCDKMHYFLPPKSHLSDGFCGMDGIILWNVVEHFGFNLQFVGQPNFGYMDNINGTYYGILKEVVEGTIDVSFNSRFMVPYGKSILYINNIGQDCLCAVVKRPEVRPIWYFPVQAFKANVWVIILAMLIFTGVFTWAKLQLKKYLIPNTLPIKSIIFYIEESLISGFLGFFLIKTVTASFLRALCLLCSIVISATYQGHVNFVFTTLVRFALISTLRDMCMLGFTIYTSPGVKNLLEPPLNEIHEELITQRLKVIRELTEKDAFNKVLEYPNSATLRRQSDFELETLKFYTDESDEPIFTIVDECFRCYYLSYISTKGFLFETHLENLIERLNEAGLPNKYYEWTWRSLRLGEPRPYSSSKPRPNGKVELQDLKVVFGILIAGYTVSIGVFVCEVYWITMRAK